ncbi:MAG TPA: patatin-like phospholipase family protein [Burkholderiales bacterium]|nr:patatin-like phospholipase family protein [Burkholderiales bacterium]
MRSLSLCAGARVISGFCLLASIAGCGTLKSYNASFNDALAPKPASADPGVGFAGAKPRATFDVDGSRGNEKVLFFLALSGGGSRAAYLAGTTMLRLQTYFSDVDLLQEVDAISSVSGGSLPAAYYAVTRDASLRPVGRLTPLAAAHAGRVSDKLHVGDDGTLRCRGALATAETERLRDLVGTAASAVRQMCEQPLIGGLRTWDASTVDKLMTQDYLGSWLWSWLYPDNILKYWLTAFDRADIMAQTLEDSLYDRPVLGLEYTFSDLNPERPFLIVNATNATEQVTKDEDGLLPDVFSFGSVFTFTNEDFDTRLNSDISKYSVARAVMASSAFPLVFPNVTLRDYRAEALEACKQRSRPLACDEQRYLHIFDGGNSDNLGLKSIKRALLELDVRGELDNYERVVVLLVDAFTKPAGARRTDPDPRSLLSLFLDMNFMEAFDALLQANRARQIADFRSGTLRWSDGDCLAETQNLPPKLCGELQRSDRYPKGYLDLEDKLFFYHFGFDDVQDEKIRAAVYRIPTSYKISEDHAKLVRDAVDSVMPVDPRLRANPCLDEIRHIVRRANGDGTVTPAKVARSVCNRFDRVPVEESRN